MQKKLLPFINAYIEGKQIQIFYDNKWHDKDEYSFDSDPSNYRIKSEPKYRPFKSVEECWGEMQKHQPFGWIKNDKGTYLSITIVATTIENFKQQFNKFKFVDDSPFGIKEEQL